MRTVELLYDGHATMVQHSPAFSDGWHSGSYCIYRYGGVSMEEWILVGDRACGFGDGKFAATFEMID